MQFTDITFLLVFLPMALIMFHASKDRVRPYIILMLSVFFYATMQPHIIRCFCIFIFLNSSVIFILGQIDLKKGIIRKLLLLVTIITNIFILAYYKYISDYFPIGLSFCIFKVISMLCDTYKEDVKANNIIDVLNYFTFFGQMQSGPITKYATFSKKNKYEFDVFAKGIERFIIGFSKKILIADVLAKIVDEVFSYNNPSTSYAWLGSICFSLQLYYDFSGYTDMAIGISQMFGFGCDENFNYPYAASTFSEFWRRWHMTLGGWYKRYIYIPLGGSKVGAWRWVFNTAIVWLITGIWHGNTIGFIVWGMSYFVLLLLEKFTGIRDKASKHLLVSFLYRIFMLCMINFLWVIFYFGEMNQAIVYIRNMLFFQGNDISVDRFKYLLSNYWIIIFVAIIFATPLFTYLKKKMIGSYVGETFYVARILAIGLCFIVAVANVIAGSSNNFIYIGF